MGSRPKAPKLPPPPPPPIDEADRAPIDAALAKKSAMSLAGYRKTFLSPRGPGGPTSPAHQPAEAPAQPPRLATPRAGPNPNNIGVPAPGEPYARAPAPGTTPNPLDAPVTRRVLRLFS